MFGSQKGRRLVILINLNFFMMNFHSQSATLRFTFSAYEKYREAYRQSGNTLCRFLLFWGCLVFVIFMM